MTPDNRPSDAYLRAALAEDGQPISAGGPPLRQLPPTESPPPSGPRVIPHTGPRVETGAVQFGDDWPGLFIRGDNAFGLLLAIDAIKEGEPVDAWTLMELRSWRDLIARNVIVGGVPPRTDAGSRKSP